MHNKAVQKCNLPWALISSSKTLVDLGTMFFLLNHVPADPENGQKSEMLKTIFKNVIFLQSPF